MAVAEKTKIKFKIFALFTLLHCILLKIIAYLYCTDENFEANFMSIILVWS